MHSGGYRVWQIYIHLMLTHSHVALENEGWKQLQLGLVDMLMANWKVATIMDKTAWENVFINVHYLTQQNYFLINGFA